MMLLNHKPHESHEGKTKAAEVGFATVARRVHGVVQLSGFRRTVAANGARAFSPLQGDIRRELSE
jgi:hypothetical protein